MSQVQGETGVEAKVEDEGNLDANPFCIGIGVRPAGRGDTRADSLEGETLRDAALPILIGVRLAFSRGVTNANSRLILCSERLWLCANL